MDSEKFFDEENEEQEFSFDYKRYLYGIYKRKWIVLGIFFIVLIPWLLNVISKPPEYEAFTWIQFKNYDPEKIKVLNSNRFIQLTSRTFAEKVVAELGLAGDLIREDKKLGLMRQEVFSEFFTSEEPVPGKYILSFKDANFAIYLLLGDEENRKEIVSGNIYEIVEKSYSINGFTFRLRPEFMQIRDEIRFDVRRFRNTVTWFQSFVDVTMGKGGTMMKIRMTYDNPAIVAQMVNRLAFIFVEESKSFEKKNIDDRKIAIENRLESAKQKLDNDQRNLADFLKTNFKISLDADVENQISKQSLFEVEKSDLEYYRDVLKDYLGKMVEYGKSFITPGEEDSNIRYIYSKLVQNKLFVNDATMGIHAQELLKNETARQDLLRKKIQPSSKMVIEIDNKIAEIQQKIFDSCNRVLEKTAADLILLNRQINSISREINNLPAERMRLANLQTEVKSSQQIYNKFLMQSTEFEIIKSVATEEIDILDPAIPPELPVNRGKKRLAGMGGVLALFLSVGMALFLEFMDKSVKSPADIKKYLKLDVIGTIPRVEFENENELKDADKLKHFDSQLVTYDDSPTPISEAYRALRTKIVYSKKIGKIKAFVVTSFAPSDGKSFTSANLAITLAQHKTNTILIDSDLRRGVLHNTFGIKKEPGISNLLMGMVKFDDIVQETYVPNLSLVSCGSMMPNPSELLGSIYLKQFIEEAKSRFDTIIFDSPPLNAATDAVVLGTQLDGVVLIVRADITNRNVAKQKLDLFENVPANILGVILNGANTELAHDGYSYYHY